MWFDIFLLLLIISAGALLLGGIKRIGELWVLGACLLMLLGMSSYFVGLDREVGVLKTEYADLNQTQIDYNFSSQNASSDFGVQTLSWLLAAGGIICLLGTFRLIRLSGGG